jgi:hypothetical protein
MTARTLLVAALALLVPVPVLAQAASPGSETRLEMERRQRRPVVRPIPPAETAERDANAAAEEIEQQRHREETLSGVTRPVPRRPDLDYDVKSGIQSQRLNDALRRR